MQEGIEGGEMLRELEQCLIVKLISFVSFDYP